MLHKKIVPCGTELVASSTAYGRTIAQKNNKIKSCESEAWRDYADVTLSRPIKLSIVAAAPATAKQSRAVAR
jgi:hypothetical protein